MKIYKLSAKTWKDKRDAKNITLYHISPNHLTALMPRSKLLKTGRIGIFLSPSYKSIITDWAAYVKGKKHKQHPLEFNRNKLQKQIQMLEQQPKTVDTETKILELEDKIAKINQTTRDNDKYDKSVEGYKTLYIHAITCPKSIYEEAKHRMNKAFEEDSVKSFGFWNWGEQIFIDAEFLPQLQIITVEKIDLSSLYDSYRDFSRDRYMKPKMTLTPQEEKEWEQQRLEKIEKARLEKEKREQWTQYDKMKLNPIS
jgi:hypothetical protein